MNKIKKVIKKLIPKRYRKSIIEWKNLIFDGYAIKSYSQEGEDIILRRLFEKTTNWFLCRCWSSPSDAILKHLLFL